jgi:hypothetical protein
VRTRWIARAALAVALAAPAAACGHHAGGLEAEAAAARDRMCGCQDLACGQAAAVVGRTFESRLRARYQDRADVPDRIQAIGREFQTCREALEARLGVGMTGPAHGLRGIRPGPVGPRIPALHPPPAAPTVAPPTAAAPGPAAPLARTEVEALRTRLRDLDAELRVAQQTLDAATTDAERHRAQARLDALARNRREVMQRARAEKRGGP